MDQWSRRVAEWVPPHEWRRVLVVDAHTEGEPLRVIVEGFPDPGGASILERRALARRDHDELRRALMWEPRGHADMYGCIVGPPVTPDADIGVLFTHNEGFSTMCGHGIIGVTTVCFECGVREADSTTPTLGIDTPAGFVRATAHLEGGRVARVSFVNVPSFVERLDAVIDVAGVGKLRYDLAFGGAYYAYVDASDFGLRLVPEETDRLIEVGRAIKEAVQSHDPPRHPVDDDLSFMYGTIFVGAALEADGHSRNVCVFADGEVDRSPTGTGVSGRLAIHVARGEVGLGQEIIVESILGTRFAGRALDRCDVAGREAIVPEVSGRAWITGRSEVFVDPHDPLGSGFLLR